MPKRLLLTLIPFAFLAVFFFYPLAIITARGLAPDGVIDLSAFGQIIRSPFYLDTVWFTFWQATVSTLLTVLAALPAAYVFARFTFRGKTLLQALTTIPFVLPTVVVAAAFSALIGPRGWVNELLKRVLNVDYAPLDIQNTIWIILLAHVFYNFTIVLRIVSGFWSNLDPQIENAARVLGANRRRAFFEVTLTAVETRHPRRFTARLHLRLHLVRRDLDPGRAAVQHHRDSHLSQDADHARSAAGDRVGISAVGLHFRADGDIYAPAKSSECAARSASAPAGAASSRHARRENACFHSDCGYLDRAARTTGGPRRQVFRQ